MKIQPTARGYEATAPLPVVQGIPTDPPIDDGSGEAGALAGNGNSYTTPVEVFNAPKIMYQVATFATAGSFTSGTPIKIGGTNHAVADLPLNLMSTLGIGVFHTE